MSLAPSSGSGGHTARRGAASRAAVDWLALAASPTFATMALVTGVTDGGAAQMLCMTASGSPLSGMVAMYVLMSVFHLGPWVRLARARGRSHRR